MICPQNIYIVFEGKIRHYYIKSIICRTINSIIYLYFIFQRYETEIIFASKTEIPTVGLSMSFWSRGDLPMYLKSFMKSKECSTRSPLPYALSEAHVTGRSWALLHVPWGLFSLSLNWSHPYRMFAQCAGVHVSYHRVRFLHLYHYPDSGSFVNSPCLETGW